MSTTATDDTAAATPTQNGTVVPVSVRERERFTPAHYTAKGTPAAPPPVYLLAPLRSDERRLLNRIAIKTCGMFVSTNELREALREAAVVEWGADRAVEIAATIEVLEQCENATERDESTEALMKDAQQKVGRWQNELSRLPGGETLRNLIALQLEQLDILSLLGVRFCVRGWEELSTKYIRRGGMLAEEAMRAIPDADQEELAARCLSLRQVMPDQE